MIIFIDFVEHNFFQFQSKAPAHIFKYKAIAFLL